MTTLLAVVSSTISTMFQPKLYVSRTTLMIGTTITNPNPDSGQIYIASQLAEIYADIAKREPIQTATMEALGIDWLPSYNVRVVPNTQLIEIAVSDTNPERAQIIANMLAEQLMKQSPTTNDTELGQRQEFVRQQLSSLQLQIDDTKKKIEELQKSLGSINSTRQTAATEKEIADLTEKLNTLYQNYASFLANSQQGAVNNLRVVEPANLPTQSVGTSKILIIGLAGMVGLVLSIGAAYLIEFLDRSIKSTSDVQRVFNYSVIGYLPVMSEDGNHATHILKHPNSVVTESFRLLQSNLEFFQAYNSAKTILVTSPMQGNGKTTIAVNLALLLATSGQKTVLVDSDLRRPAVHAALEMEKASGLSDIVRSKKKPAEVVKSIEGTRIDVITAGEVPPNVTEVVGSKRIAEILHGLKDDYETVVIDAPPLVISNSYNLASKVDGVILVLEQGQTREEQAKVIKEQLNRAGARVVGVVFNRVTEGNAKSYGDYQYLSMYAPQHYNDYVSRSPQSASDPVNTSPTKKVLAFFERGEVPTDVTESLEGAFDKFQKQRDGLRHRFRKAPKQAK
ncbi:MAG: polysaccharide biosynthesis tyrosine autokinase [Anaerolineales bacterium]